MRRCVGGGGTTKRRKEEEIKEKREGRCEPSLGAMNEREKSETGLDLLFLKKKRGATLRSQGLPARSPPKRPHTVEEEEGTMRERRETRWRKFKKKRDDSYSTRSASTSLSECSGLPTLILMNPESSFLA